MKLFTSISIITVLFLSTCVYADTYLPLGSRLYDDLKYLEAEGIITTSQLATLPISRREGARLTKEAMEGSVTPSRRVVTAIDRLLTEFKRELEGDDLFFTPADSANLQYGYSDREGFFAQKNRDGTEVRRGNNISLDLTSRFESRYLGAAVMPELDIYEDATHFGLKKAYLLANLGKEEFMLGKENAWWGPGQNGSVLLSTNAEPLTSLKISNSVPYFPFGIGIRATFFITQLEKDRRDVREPILHGIRLDIKPARFLEIGLSKTAMFGGEGRKEDFGAFLDSFFSIGENDTNDPGDQRAGGDVKLVLPWKRQPVTLYFEAAGEDQKGVLPFQWFTLYGIYLPRVLNLDRLGLSAEFARTTHNHWYTHHLYTQGYTYNERVIGHYIGGGSRHMWLQARYHFEPAILTLSYERLHKDYPEKYDWQNFEAAAFAELSKSTEMTVSAGYAKEAENNLLLQIGVRYRF